MPMLEPTTINQSTLEKLFNITSLDVFMINVNQIVYGGWLFFLLLVTLNIILFNIYQSKENQIITNLLYSTGIVSILSLILRIIYITVDGIQIGFITDVQLWIFPIVTGILEMISWADKN